MRVFFFLASFGLAILMCVAAPLKAGDGTVEDPLVFGVIPARSPEQVLGHFGPLISAMKADLSLAINLRGAPDFETFLRRVLDGDTYDIVLTGGDTVQFLRGQNLYRPVVQMGGPGIFAVIAVQKESRFDSLEALSGRASVATADLLAYSTGLGFRRLAEAGLDPGTDLDVVVVPSQSAALAALVRGQVDAAIIMAPVLRSAPVEMRQGLRVLAETERAPPPAISISTRMRPDLADQVTRFLLSLEDVESGALLLERIGWPGIAPVRIEDYDALDWAAESIADRLRKLAD